MTPFFISEVTPSFLSIVFAVQPAIIPTPTTAPIDAVAGKSAVAAPIIAVVTATFPTS
ncbi:hypothetical protein SD640_002800, partial [Enterococcus faecalis]|nr:hypothetical protein [Enterococcus faecalis]